MNKNKFSLHLLQIKFPLISQSPSESFLTLCSLSESPLTSVIPYVRVPIREPLNLSPPYISVPIKAPLNQSPPLHQSPPYIRVPLTSVSSYQSLPYIRVSYWSPHQWPSGPNKQWWRWWQREPEMETRGGRSGPLLTRSVREQWTYTEHTPVTLAVGWIKSWNGLHLAHRP